MSEIDPIAFAFIRDALTCAIKEYQPHFEFCSDYGTPFSRSKFTPNIKTFFMITLEQRRPRSHSLYAGFCGPVDVEKLRAMNGETSHYYERSGRIDHFLKYCADMCECTALAYTSGFLDAPQVSLSLIYDILVQMGGHLEFEYLDDIARQALKAPKSESRSNA